jgi:prephenate dehydrogenase
MTELSSLRVAIAGVGLIGGSLARVLKAAGVTREIVGISRTQESLDKALMLGVIDRGATRVPDVGEMDIVVLATPLRVMPDLMRAFAPHLGADTVVTDVGSVKGFVCEAAEQCLGEARSRFVPAHPIAGTEHSGVEASFASLFENRAVILTPDEQVSRAALEKVSSMWRLAGATLEVMSPRKHDELLAATSHLPHMVAYALVSCLARHPESEELFHLAAGGFYDFTRIASSDPVMWRDIGLTNSGPLVASLQAFRTELDALLEALEDRDETTLQQTFSNAKRARDLGLARKNLKK